MTKVRKKIGTIPINDIEQQVQQSTSAAITQMQQDVSDFIDEETAQYPEIGGTFKYIEDPEERSEVTTDKDGRILSYRDSDGIKHENVGIVADSSSFNHLELSKDGMTEFQQALKNSGFRGGSGDWSDYISNNGESPLCIPEPRCAILNIISDFNLSNLSKEGMSGAIEGVNYNIPTQIEFWDMQGNYFKKWILMSGQGASTMGLPKKSIAMDLFDSSVYDSGGKLGKGDAFKVKFGDWVAQDSFHLKAYMLAGDKTTPMLAYQLYNEIVRSRGEAESYTWKMATIDESNITAIDSGVTTFDDWVLQFDTGARCFPDGFPVIVYQNGAFWGMYTWQLKKHRDNYKMNKKEAKHIHLDGEAFDIFSYNGNIDWDVIAGTKADSIGITGDLEVRNPKDLYLADGTKYNSDTNRGELMSSSSATYDSTNKDHVRTAKVRKYLEDLSKSVPTINEAVAIYEASSKTTEDLATLKSVFETYFEPKNLIDYLIISDLINNWDGFNHNVQWTTWDGVKWYCNIYDTDNTFMTSYMPPFNKHIINRAAYTALPQFVTLVAYYQPELNSRYKELRDLGIINSIHITDMYVKWEKRLSLEDYTKEFNKWDGTTQYSIIGDTVYRLKKYLDAQIAYLDTVYNYNQY